MNTISINVERELYVIDSGAGYSCRGFDNVLRELRLIATRIQGFDWVASAMDDVRRGSLEAYRLYERAVGEVVRSGIKTATWFPEGTLPTVTRVLERCRKDNTEVRVFFGNPVTGRDALEECDVHGRIGRSSGPFRIPLLCTDRFGGGALASDRILRIVEVRTRKELYRHPRWHLPEVALQPTTDLEALKAGYRIEAQVDGWVHARFVDLPRAGHWLAMMAGESLESPDSNGGDTDAEVED